MSQLPELPWIAEARRHIGQREIKGTRHNPFIVGIWAATGVSWFLDDETPCAPASSPSASRKVASRS